MTVQPAAISDALSSWHRMVARRDMSDLGKIVHPNAVFRSPMAHTPYGPAPALIMVLSTVIEVFEDFTYHRRLVSDDGHSVVLEFSARVGDMNLKGVDLIRFDADGRIVEFEVMVRPMSGLQALGAQMSARLAHRLPPFKTVD